MSLNEERWGEGEAMSRLLLAEGAIGFGSDCASDEPRLPGDMNLDTKSAEPSFSHLCPSSCIALHFVLQSLEWPVEV